MPGSAGCPGQDCDSLPFLGVPCSVTSTILTSLRVSGPLLLLRGHAEPGMKLRNLPMAFFCPLSLPSSSCPSLTARMAWPSWGNSRLKASVAKRLPTAPGLVLSKGQLALLWLPFLDLASRPNLLPASCMTPSLQAYYWPPTYVHDMPMMPPAVQNWNSSTRKPCLRTHWLFENLCYWTYPYGPVHPSCSRLEGLSCLFAGRREGARPWIHPHHAQDTIFQDFICFRETKAMHPKDRHKRAIMLYTVQKR